MVRRAKSRYLAGGVGLLVALLGLLALSRPGGGLWPPRPARQAVKEIAVPTDRASCLAAAGRWIETFGGPACSLPTSDSGWRCQSSAECEGHCMAPVSYAEALRLSDAEASLITHGTCSAWRLMISCQAFVEDGRLLTVCGD